MKNKPSQGETVNNRVDHSFGAAASNTQHRAAVTKVSNRQGKIVYGDRPADSLPGSVLRAAMESRRWRMYVGNIKEGTSEDSLKQFCAVLGVVVFQAEVISNSDREGSNRPVAMRVDVDYDARNMVMSASFLPKGVKFRGWRVKYGYKSFGRSDRLIETINMDETYLRIASYNMDGFNIGMPYLMDLLKQNDIIVFQEHWLKDRKLSNICESFDSVCKPAMEHVATREVLVGRPFGGNSDFMEEKLSNVKIFKMQNCAVSCGDSRCVAISVQFDNCVVYIFNVYLLCLHKMSDEEEMQIVECMGFIDETVQSIFDCGYNRISVIILGDFNASYDAINNNGRLTCLRMLLQDLDMVCCDDLNLSGVNNTYKHKSLNHSSCIDHVFVSRYVEQRVSAYTVMDSGSNLSDHNALCFVLSVVNY